MRTLHNDIIPRMERGTNNSTGKHFYSSYHQENLIWKTARFQHQEGTRIILSLATILK